MQMSPLVWHHHIAGPALGADPLKRSHSPDVQIAALSDDGTPTIDVKRARVSYNSFLDPVSKKQPSKVPKLSDPHRSEIIRRYGRRLIGPRMRSFCCHDSRDEQELRYAGSKIVHYLVAKKYERLEDLHDEYEMSVRENCRSALRERVLSEMQKFRRAGPVWWKECVEKTNQSSRLEIMNTVFEDIKQGKYTAGDGRT